MTANAAGLPWPMRPLGATGLMVGPLWIGTSELGGMTQIYPDAVGEEQALATARAIFAGPIPFVDTAAGYGESERRLGIVLREHGGLPDGAVLSTKVGCRFTDGVTDGDHARRSVERSLRLLGLDHLQLVYIHDPENTTFERVMAPGGLLEALQTYKAQGVIGHLGIAGGPIDLLTRFVETGAFEAVISHNRYTLLNTSANPLWDLAGRLGIGTLNGGVYGGGMLSKGPAASPRYAYRAATVGELERARKLEAICTRHGVPLAAAALQFSLRDPRITSTMVGISFPERLDQTLALAQHPIPEGFWAEYQQSIEPETTDPQGW